MMYGSFLKFFILFFLISSIVINVGRCEVLINEGTYDSHTLRAGESLSLVNGLCITAMEIDVDGGEAWIGLSQDGGEVHNEVVQVYNYFSYEGHVTVSFYITEIRSTNVTNIVSFSNLYVCDNTIEYATAIATVSSYGTLGVSTSPDSTAIYLDGYFQGYTTSSDWFWIYNVPAGSHEIKLMKDGYNDVIRTVYAASDETTYISETLTRQTGSISVSSYPSGGNVYLDGTYKGTTPLTIPDLSIGSYVIKITKSGYNDIFKTATVSSGETATISTSLNTLTGSIYANSEPNGAGIYLDENYKGQTPQTIPNVPIGEHTLKLSKDGYEEISHTITVASDQTTTFSKSLTGETGSISVSSNPSGAEVYIDGIYKGLTPKTISDVPVGKHVIVLAKPGYETASSEITVSSGQTKSLSGHLPLNPILIFGGVSLLLLAIIGVVAVRKKKKNNALSGNKVPSTPIKTQPSAKQVQPVSVVNTTKKPKDKGTIDIKSAFQYQGATIQYKVKIINQTTEPISDIKIQLFVPDVFMLTQKENSIPMLEPKESKTVTFDIRPTGECGDCAVSGRMNYYDYGTKKRQDIDIEKKMLSIVCPVLKRKEIDEDGWRNATEELIKAEENTKDIDIPAENLFNIATRVLKDMSMYMIKPEITSTPQLFTGVGMFYAEGAAGLHYAAYIEVVGGRKSRMILKAWAEKEEALTGFYHKILDEIEKRLDIKIFIDEGIIQYHVHKTEIKDNIIQRSNIDLGTRAQCPECGREVEANEKFCLECGAKL